MSGYDDDPTLGGLLGPLPAGHAPGEQPTPRRCPTRTPEPHELGEFPMTCYRCHVDADA